MKKQLLLFLTLAVILSSCSQKNEMQKYVEQQNGEIIQYDLFESNKNESIARFKEKLGPDEYFDILYEFEDPIVSNDSIIMKVKRMMFSRYPPQMNAKNVFNENSLIGKEIPIKDLQTLTGKTITLEALKGKPTVLNFWHVKCGPCIKEMPTLNEIHNEFGDRVNFVAVTFDSKEKVEKFLDKKAFNFTHVINAADFMNEIQIKVFPRSIYLDKDGVVQRTEGVLLDNEKEEAVNYIKTLL